MKIVGIDASINSTGLVSFTLDNNLSVTNVEFMSFTQVKKNSNGQTVLHFKKDDFGNYISQNIFMRDQIEIFCSGASYVAFEDYAYAAVGKVFHIAEFTGCVKTCLYESGLSLRFYDPPTIKMYATGKGNADKIRMVDAFDVSMSTHKPDLTFLIDVARPKSRYDSPRSDIVDAYFITNLLHLELLLKYNGSGMTLNQITDTNVRNIFERKTKGNPVPLIKRDFLTKGKI